MRSASQHYLSFLAVARCGSISAAASELGLPRPTVSRQVSRLEADLGVALLHRTTRKVTPTAAGQRLLERLVPLLDAWEEVEQEARSQAVELVGTVRISVTPLLAVHVAPVVRTLVADHPRLELEVVANVRLVDLRTEGYDAAIWAGDPRDGGLVSRTVAVGTVALYAAPAYLERAGTPTTPDDLAGHTLLRGHSGSARPRVYWPLADGGRFRIGGGFVTNDAPLLLQAALDGVGIALLPELSTQAHVAAGTLAPVLPGVVGERARVRLLTANRTPPARVRAVLDALVAGFQVPVTRPA